MTEPGEKSNSDMVHLPKAIDYAHRGPLPEPLTDMTETGEKSNPYMVQLPKSYTDRTSSKKLYIFCGVLLTIIVILSIAFGYLTYTLIMRTETLGATSDELRATIQTIEANQQQISNLTRNGTADELNCTWGSWSTFSPCTATCDAGIQHRERRCESVDPDLREYRIETDIQTCNIEACPEGLHTDCKDIMENGNGTSDGVYSVTLCEIGEVIQVFCDMTTDGGGWTVFQKRVNGSVDFYRGFNEYENGFGSVYGEFWLGQSFSFNNGFAFSTYDRDVDSSPLYNIAEQKHGAWWYRNNGVENLNGHYVTPGTLSSYYYGSGGVVYGLFDGHLSLKSTEMKFRKKY